MALNNSRRLAIAGSVVALAVLSYLYFSTSAKQSAQQSQNASEPIEVTQLAEGTEPVTASSKKADLAPEILKSLGQIEEMLANLDARVGSIEDELDLARLDNPDRQNADDNAGNDDDEYSAENLARREKNKQYLQNLEQFFSQASDEQVTNEVQARFDGMISERPQWLADASVQSTQCGADHCKVVLRYKNDMEPIDKFELENMALVYLGHMPSSVTRTVKNADGTTDYIIYAAKRDAGMPRPE